MIGHPPGRRRIAPESDDPVCNATEIDGYADTRKVIVNPSTSSQTKPGICRLEDKRCGRVHREAFRDLCDMAGPAESGQRRHCEHPDEQLTHQSRREEAALEDGPLHPKAAGWLWNQRQQGSEDDTYDDPTQKFSPDVARPLSQRAEYLRSQLIDNPKL